MTLTREQIYAVADKLDSQGQKPTLARVRATLGSGSYTTISDAMNEWKARKVAAESPLREPLPPQLEERFVGYGIELWSVALELANGRLMSERESIESEKIQMEVGRREAVELADQVTAELEQAVSRICVLEASEQEVRKAAEELRKQLTAMHERAAIAEARVVEIEKRADDLNEELLRLNRQNAEQLRVLAEWGKEKQAPDQE